MAICLENASTQFLDTASVEIEVLEIVTQSIVFFFAEPSIGKNVMGRGGWLDRVRVGLVDHDRETYLAEYGHD